MKNLAIACVAAAALFLAADRPAEAGGGLRISVGYGGYGYGGYGVPYNTGAYRYGLRTRGHYDWHDTSHYHVQPGYTWRHGDHYHYEPSRVILHRQGHWDYHRGPHIYHGH